MTTDKTISDSNKLIADFIGATLSNHAPNEYDMFGIIECIEDGEDEKHFFTPELMKFHTSWDWLIPVLARIKETQRNGNSDYSHLMNTTLSMLVNNGLDPTYRHIVNFIERYNTQNRAKKE